MKSSGNTVIITGATAGIGLAMTHKFCKEGNTVIAVGRNRQKLDELTKTFGNRVVPFVCDLNQLQDIDRLISFIKTEHPGTNILINNAAVQHNYSFVNEEHTTQLMDEEIGLNLIAPLRLIYGLAPVISGNEHPAIINLTSGLGFVPKSSAPVYCGTKAALHIFTKSLRYQLESEGITVIEVIPSLVDTAMTAGRGTGKISPEQLVEEFWRGFLTNKPEINIGKVKLLRFLQRWTPRIADRIMKGK